MQVTLWLTESSLNISNQFANLDGNEILWQKLIVITRQYVCDIDLEADDLTDHGKEGLSKEV